MDFPRPISHKVIYIGGIGKVQARPLEKVKISNSHISNSHHTNTTLIFVNNERQNVLFEVCDGEGVSATILANKC